MNRKLLPFVALLACLALPLGHLAAQDDTPAPLAANFLPDGEPNDTFATASGLFDSGYDGTYLMTPADVDFFRLDLTSAYRISPQLGMNTGYYDDPAVLRAELALFNSAQTLLAQDADCDETTVLPEMSVPAGVYYFRVRACAGAFDSDQSYGLSAYGDNARPIEWEPNNSRATANPFDNADAAISPAGDVDFYRFEATAGQTWYANLEARDATLTPEMALQDANGTVLATSGPGYLYYDVTATGTYYFRVRASNPGGTGAYRIYGGETTPYPPPGDDEPNDTPAQAVAIKYGASLWGESGGANDPIDYYRFEGQAGDPIAISQARYNEDEWVFPVIQLFDPAMNPVPLNHGMTEPYRVSWTTLPVSGVYRLAFTGVYHHWLARTGSEEPNNTLATATDIVLDETLEVIHDYPCDDDWYRFQGRAGDILPNVNATHEDVYHYVNLYTADGAPHDGVILSSDGVYYLRVQGWGTDYDAWWCWEGEYNEPFAKALWISAAVDGLGGDASIKRGDIVTRKTPANRWAIVFDASDVGITQNVNGFTRMPNGSILMSLAGAQNVPGLGQVMPHDIIRFSPTSLGNNTVGTFQWFLDGSDVGLTAAGEKIDAIYFRGDINTDVALVVSLSGAAKVPWQSGGDLAVDDEDLINFVALRYGADSAGKWRMSDDATSLPGMAAEDINGVEFVRGYPSRFSFKLITLASAFNLGGMTGGPMDVLSLGTDDDPSYPPFRMANKKIDAIGYGPAWHD